MGHFAMQRRTTSIDDAIGLFMLDARARRLTHSTQTFYRSKLKQFSTWFADQEISELDSVTSTHLRRFLVSLQERNLSPSYQHNIARAVRAFFNFCQAEELIEGNPMQRVPMPKQDYAAPIVLSGEEVRRVLDACQNERDRAVVLVLLDSGVRASELIALNVADVELDSGTVRVHKGKGRKDRTTQIGANTRKQVKRYLMQRGNPSTRDPLFTSFRDGARLSLDGLVQLMGRLQKRSGVQTATAHAFRRTFAVNCLRNGMNIYILAKMMGHSDIMTLRKYLSFVEDDVKAAHEDAGPVDNLL